MAVMLPLCKKFICVRTFYIALIAFFAGFGLNFYFSLQQRDGVNFSLPRHEKTVHEGYEKRDTSVPSHLSPRGDNTKIIFNVLPKTGSKDLFMLVKDVVLYLNREIDIKTTMNPNLTRSYDEKLDEIREFVRSPGIGFLYTYMRYFKFQDDTVKPTYISIVSDPIDRLASHYQYFINENCRERELKKTGERQNCKYESFEECVLNNGDLCKSRGDLVGHFCGTDKHPCKSHARSSRAYARALFNIQNNYVTIGITEDFEGFIKILEKLLPNVFNGCSQIYHQRKSVYKAQAEQLKQTIISEEARNILMKRLSVDYRLYNFIKEKYRNTKQELGIIDLSSWMPL